MFRTRRVVGLLCFLLLLLLLPRDQPLFLVPRGREPSRRVLLIVRLCGVIIVISHTIPERLVGGFMVVLLTAVVEADGVVVPLVLIIPL